MDVGHVVYFRSQQHPFLVETHPCLDLECSCQEMELTLREILPPSGHPRDRLTFTMRICLRTWQERNPPPRSLEVESLAREFLARFPASRVLELCEEFEQARASQRQFETITLTDSPDKLVSYAQVVGDGRSVRDGNAESCFFFVFEGREFLVEDQYCANPQCDCGCVHLEFWERVPQRKSGFRIVQQLEATFSLEGKLVKTRYSHEDAETTKYLLQAWLRRCSEQFAEYRRCYDEIKQVGARSFPVLARTQPLADAHPLDGGIARAITDDTDRRGATFRQRTERTDFFLGAAHAPQRSVSLRQRPEVQTLLRATSGEERLIAHRKKLCNSSR